MMYDINIVDTILTLLVPNQYKACIIVTKYIYLSNNLLW